MTPSQKEHDVHAHHEELVAGLREQMSVILEKSHQPILIYLDDSHKTCNEKFAKLAGYGSVEEFERVEENFLETFVAEESQEMVMNNYHGSFTQELRATILPVVIKTKDGKKMKATLIHVPMLFQNHLFAVSFVDV